MFVTYVIGSDGWRKFYFTRAPIGVPHTAVLGTFTVAVQSTRVCFTCSLLKHLGGGRGPPPTRHLR